MIYYVCGNIFESSARVLVNPVSTNGIADDGLALEFKKRYPKAFTGYQSACKAGFRSGQILLVKGEDHDILCFPVRRNSKSKPSLVSIEAGLKAFRNGYRQKGIESAAFPILGCEEGGLLWEELEPLMERYLRDLPIDIFVYKEREKRNDNQSSEIAKVSA